MAQGGQAEAVLPAAAEHVGQGGEDRVPISGKLCNPRLGLLTGTRRDEIAPEIAACANDQEV